MIALEVLREGGHFVCKIYDMFTSFTVGLIYFMYRTFDSVAIFKPETLLPASSDRYILCKYRKANQSIIEIKKYLMDCLTSYSNCQRLYRDRDENKADILELVPLNVIQRTDGFYDHILSANAALGELQLKQTDEICRNVKMQNAYMIDRLAETWKKAHSLWGVKEYFKLNAKFTEAATPELRGAKLVRPYQPDILHQIERDGEQVLGFANMEEELTHPKEWHFVPVGRDRGFYLSLGGTKVYHYSGSGNKWEETDKKIELSDNTLVYADIVEEIVIFEDKQIITSALNIIDAIILGGKDVRTLPYSERHDLCQKFARSMNKPNRDDLWAVRAKQPRELLEIHKSLAMIKDEKLKGGAKGPSKQAILPVEDGYLQPEGQRAPRRPRAPCVFKPLGFSIFKTCKGGGVPADFSYSLQNRLYWRFTEDVNLDPAFDGWKQDAEEKFGPIHAATLIDFLKTQLKK
jgi:cap1 methyltransferase